MSVTDIAIGAGAGFASGLVTGLASAVLVLTARRARNARLVRRGQAPYRDLVLPPTHVVGAIIGAIAGAVAGALSGWQAAAIAGAAVPVLLLSIGAIFALVQSGGSRPES